MRPYKNLILWLTWAATGLLTYFTLYSDTQVWSYMESDSSHITGIIVAMFLAGVLGSFALCLRITKEMRRAFYLGRQAEQGGLAAVVANAPARAVDRFFRALQATVKRDGNSDVEMLLRSALSTYDRGSHAVEVAGNLLVTLGLIGTVAGLTVTLAGLTGSLNGLGNDQEQLLQGLKQAMGGMSTAFYTTLLGAVMGGVMLRVFSLITRHGIESLHDDLATCCLVYCSAEYKESLARDARVLNDELRTLDMQMKSLEGSFGGSSRAFSGFRDEVVRFTRGDSEGEGQSLQLAIKQHQEYCNTLREEMRLIYLLNRPWYMKLVTLFSFGTK